MPPSKSRSRSPSPYSRRMALSNRREDRPRSRSPPRKLAYSPSPPRRDRPRSRSPRRRHDERPRKSGGGFRWKEKPRYGDDDGDRRDERRLERGYREQERPRRDEGRKDEGRRDEGRRMEGRRDEERRDERKREERERDEGRRDGGRRDEVEAKFGKGRDVEDKFGSRDDTAEKFGETNVNGDKPPETPKKEKKIAPAPTGEPMIIVNVNDRLGTKASIPCMASDPIRLFKAQVAASIGRQPHEIMLKRQGERPFKDQLTLEDYGVSNGVQLDLEVDTGD
ncbi:MAG: hypothetical protein ALECFALPRED_006686 [Alectoria fallacina]|uniref:Ubiquitin-like modifier HUB1 n=1 Tax=Alectoria fallacina TaxID=1903189 RepID=A0A8H3EPV6_9LECA|nr:MAG: hypothetical protein ALECFALPRED_006686 [Alectoria fallacina]